MENSNLEGRKYIRAQKKVKSIKGFYRHLVAYLVVNIFILLFRALSDGGWESFWEWQSYSTAFLWGIGLAFHAFGVFGMDFILGKSWEDKKIKEIMDNDKNKYWE